MHYPHAVFAVDDRPLCVWADNLEADNLQFCDSINPEWFIDSIAPHLEGVDLESIQELDQTRALALRLAFYHSLETFFALLVGALQAPFCLSAWLDLYDIKDLCSLIRRVNYRAPILNAWGIPRPSWSDISLLVNSTWLDKEDGKATVEGFATAWARLAADLTDENNRGEYNSIKHGFRARPGGFVLRVGIEKVPGTPAPPGINDNNWRK